MPYPSIKFRTPLKGEFVGHAFSMGISVGPSGYPFLVSGTYSVGYTVYLYKSKKVNKE